MRKSSLKTIKYHVNEWNYCGQHYKFALIIEEYYSSILLIYSSHKKIKDTKGTFHANISCKETVRT